MFDQTKKEDFTSLYTSISLFFLPFLLSVLLLLYIYIYLRERRGISLYEMLEHT